ncbi:hypothetical protein [Pajaroellobacter abortibovis]|nr:hypothetical protein [Pajaroellobacter abortibovis]
MSPDMACLQVSPSMSISYQAVIFYNVRLALRENRKADVLKFWLLRNSLVDQRITAFEERKFHSIVWVSLGDLDLCQDGFTKDERGGAGLWSLALHDWIVRSMGKEHPPESSSSFGAFGVRRQQWPISLRDILSIQELRSVKFSGISCTLPALLRLCNSQ